ncbi:hypothetical protein NPIL_67271, partial [Nephila pilipes]
NWQKSYTRGKSPYWKLGTKNIRHHSPWIGSVNPDFRTASRQSSEFQHNLVTKHRFTTHRWLYLSKARAL